MLCPGSRMTYALLMELYGFMVFETIYSSPSYLMALLGGVRVEIESHCAGTAEPAILAEPTSGSGAGAEQWY